MIYSQNNEQEVIEDFFKDFKGTFLDLGANDGKLFSNVYALALDGWKGASIEPSARAYSKLEENYCELTDIEMYNIAIAEHDGVITLHESGSLLNGDDVSLVSSTVETELKRWKPANISFTPVEVDCLTWKSFYNISKYKKFDFVSIDIEGAEFAVLPQMDFDAMKTRLICVEWNGKNLGRFNQILEPYGFRIIHTNPENLIYARR
jgi:FkbM family methyltransferase